MSSRYLSAKKKASPCHEPLELRGSRTRAYPHLRDHAFEEVEAHVYGAFDSAIAS